MLLAEGPFLSGWQNIFRVQFEGGDQGGLASTPNPDSSGMAS